MALLVLLAAPVERVSHAARNLDPAFRLLAVGAVTALALALDLRLPAAARLPLELLPFVQATALVFGPVAGLVSAGLVTTFAGPAGGLAFGAAALAAVVSVWPASAPTNPEPAHAAPEIQPKPDGLFRRPFASPIANGIALAVLYALVWAAFATLSAGRGVHTDSLEAYAWGREFAAGYYKHPPFWAWVAGLWFALVPKTNFAFLWLSEFNAALGLIGAYALMRRFADARTCALGLLLLLLTPLYQFNAQRFNANTILLSLWPWTMWAFLRALETRAARHALLCGLLAGLALLSKYVALILVATCFLASLTHPARNAYYRSAAPWLSVATALLVVSPHAVWLVSDGFQPLVYLASKTALSNRDLSNHALSFFAGCLAFFAVPAGLLAVTRWRHGVAHAASIPHGPTLVCLALAPVVFMLLAGTLGRTALGIPFAVPILALVPLLLIALVDPAREPAIRLARNAVVLVMGLCLLAAPFLPGIALRWRGASMQDPRDEVAREALTVWAEVTPAPLRFVSGGYEYAVSATFQSRDPASIFDYFDMRRSPWVTPEGIARHGLLVICRADDGWCLEQAAIYETPQSRRIARQVARRVGTATGPATDILVIVIPPRI